MRVLVSTFLLALCGTPAHAWQQVKTNELPADTLVVLQRGACEHRCAVYRIVIFADGSAIFDGQHYVRRPGVFKTTVGLDALGKLLSDAAAARFFDLKDRYVPDSPAGCGSPKSDAPTAVLSIGTGGKFKSVVHYLGCAGKDSEKLMQLEERIDKAVNAVTWVK